MKIPISLKVVYSVWAIAWAGSYAWAHDPIEFFWFCHLGNFIIAVALWTESPLLLSWQCVILIVPQIGWTIDVLGRLVLGRHLIGGTEFLFADSYPLIDRILTSFHVAMPILLLWAVWRLGFDRRAIVLAAIECWLVLPISFLAGAERNLNWVYRPFDQEQSFLGPLPYLLFCMLGYPLVIYLPVSAILSRTCGRRSAERVGEASG